jgi:DNA-binding NtrC family response regulator
MPEDDLSTVHRGPVARSTTGFRLRVTEGPDAGQSIDIATGARILLGKSPACDLKLGDPHVSRRHAVLEEKDGLVRVADQESTNGTFVNGVQIEAALLSGGEALRIGETTLALDRANIAAPPASTLTHFGKIVGASPEMRRIYPLCEKLAASDVPVVIEGETGTGKEVLAESIHEASPRKDGPFVVFDCTAVPASLMESELFGHERGAFTGATATRKGVFEQAHGGTLLIDEIGELDSTLQPKLLRAIERSEVRRVGGDKWIKVNVRVLAATRRDLDREVQDGRFRDDLFFRLAVGRIELPALRERRGDIRVLAAHFWSELGGKGRVPYDVEQRFERHSWPGNVRELRNTIARHLALGDFEASEAAAPPAIESSGPDAIDAILGQNLPFPRARQLVLRELERRYTERLLQHHGGSVAKAAEASGIARRYFNIILARGKK